LTSRSRILVVDDDAGLRHTLERILTPAYSVVVVEGVRDALVQIQAEPPFELALVDVRLRDGDGYSLCHAIRRQRPETDVILITGSLSEPDEKLYRALEEGAFYFLFKPFDRRVLQALVERCLRLQHERAAKEAHARTLADDLEKARRFQRSLVPRGPVIAGGWRLEGRLVTCDALGGDLFEAHRRDDGKVLFALSDVVGHGVGAALISGMLRSTLDAARRRDPDPATVGQDLLDGSDFLAGTAFATLIYGLLRPDGHLRYVNAGHPPMLWQRLEGPVELLPSTGLLLMRAFCSRPLPVAEVVLHPGDRLLVYSDGATEVLNPTEQELGLDRLAALLTELRPLPLSGVLDGLLAAIRDHSGGRPLQDDVTLLLIERLADADF